MSLLLVYQVVIMLLAIVKQSFLYLIRNINFYFSVLFLYSFCTDVRSNLAVCSFIRTNIIFSGFTYFLFYFIFTFFILYCIVYYVKYTCSVVNSDWLVLLYRNCYLTNVSFASLLSYLFDSFVFYFFYFLRLYRNSFVFITIYSAIVNFFSTNYWYPLYKRHSYFGYFRAMRQRWGEVKSEEVNRLKY